MLGGGGGQDPYFEPNLMMRIIMNRLLATAKYVFDTREWSQTLVEHAGSTHAASRRFVRRFVVAKVPVCDGWCGENPEVFKRYCVTVCVCLGRWGVRIHILDRIS